MMSERKLAYYEHVAEQNCSEECQKIITQLVDEVRKLEREADWLANRISITDVCANPRKNASQDCGGGECQQCWREVARRAVQIRPLKEDQ